MQERALVWLRRDLRLDDQPAIAAALDGAREAVLCFCLDERIYAGEDRAPVRLRFLLEGLGDLDRRLRELGSGLTVVRGDARIEIPRVQVINYEQAVRFENTMNTRTTLLTGVRDSLRNRRTRM